MRTFRNISLICLAILLGMIPCLAQDDDPAETEKPKDWQEDCKFTKPQIAQLTENKILIQPAEFRQIFDPYIEQTMPMFITSDSLLNAYHVLYEESVCRMEVANARRMPEILKVLWGNLDEVPKRLKCDEKLMAAAQKRARIVIGTALALLGARDFNPDKEIAAFIADEVARVRKGEGTALPKWWGKADETFLGLDYSRFKPCGFYVRSATLRNYFMAVSWLQAIPFRVSRDEEFAAMLVMAGCVHVMNWEEEQKCQRFFRRYADFVGTGDDWDIVTAVDVSVNTRDLNERELENLRKELAEKIKKEGGPEINDQLRLPPTDPNAKASEPNFRVVSACRTPDSILFHRTTNGLGRAMPQGLEICALMGSAYARGLLAEKVAAAVDANKSLLNSNGLYGQYLCTLATLVDKPEPDAPSFMAGEAWQAKSCNTVLASWAQMRHTWALQAKKTVFYAGGKPAYPGFVEPEPEFFAAMRRLVAATKDKLNDAEAFTPDLQEVAEKCRAAAELMKKYNFAKLGRKAFEKMSEEDRERFADIMTDLEPVFKDNPLDIDKSKKSFEDLIKMLETAADIIEKDQFDKYPKLRDALAKNVLEAGPLWERLHEVCSRLEALAHKQLRGVEFNETENRFIRHYGTEIAGIMFYGGNSYLSPRDDAPRIMDVYSDPNTGTVLEVGVGRPWVIYVLYPHKGVEILCRGAIMPYYEFASGKRLTDGEWRGMLDSEDCPKPPEWLKPAMTK